MAYATQLLPSYYTSWDGKTKIVRENKIENNKAQSRFSISNKELGINIQTEWYDYPFKNQHKISDLLMMKVPALKENIDLLPLIETTSKHSPRVALCSTIILKDKSKFKMYMPIYRTIDDYKKMRERPSSFQLSDGMHTRTVSPSEVIEIIEE